MPGPGPTPLHRHLHSEWPWRGWPSNVVETQRRCCWCSMTKILYQLNNPAQLITAHMTNVDLYLLFFNCPSSARQFPSSSDMSWHLCLFPMGLRAEKALVHQWLECGNPWWNRPNQGGSIGRENPWKSNASSKSWAKLLKRVWTSKKKVFWRLIES